MSYCCKYKGCYNAYKPCSSISFFKVPQDHRRQIWLKHSGEDFQSKQYDKKEIYFCEKHFHVNDILQYSIKKTLVRYAIPKSYSSVICSCTGQNIDPLCEQILRDSKVSPNVTKNILKRRAEDTTLWDDSEEDLVVKKCATDKTYSKDYKIPTNSETNDVDEWQFPSPDKMKLSEKIVERRRVPLYVYTSPKGSNNSKKSEESVDAIEKLLNEKSEDVQTFVKSQLFHKKSGKWAEKEKKLAIKYYYLSPALYRHFLNTGFSLPSVATIMKWHSALRFETGLSAIVIDMLKNKFAEMPKINCKSILLFDEMSTKKELEYNTKDDLIYGFTDLASLGRENQVSSSVMFFMLRGLNQNWKQAISYVVGPVSAANLSCVLEDHIKKLLNTDCELKGVTCDQAATNRSCYKKFGVTKEKPYFFIEGKKIFAFYDIPHLIKSVRNCLYSNDIEIDGNIVSWEIIRDVYNFDNGSVRATYKLTDIHVDPKNFDRMSMKVAT